MPMPLSAKVKTQTHAPARGCLDGGGKAYAAALGEFHRVVGQVLQRRAQPHRIADRLRRQIVRDRDFGGRGPCWPRARSSAGATASASARGENGSLRSTSPAASALAASTISVVSARQMLGAALDRLGPAALARAEIGGGQQFGQRHDAGQRRADVVRDAGRARLRSRARAPARGVRFARRAPWLRSCAY